MASAVNIAQAVPHTPRCVGRCRVGSSRPFAIGFAIAEAAREARERGRRQIEHADNAMRDHGAAEITPSGPWLDPERLVHDMQRQGDGIRGDPKLAADLSVA
jgi:hypothetical protein